MPPINSLVIRRHGRHVTRTDYSDTRPVLSHDNVLFPRAGTLQARALRRLLAGELLTHRSFDRATHSYRLGSSIDRLRDKGWPVVNHDEIAMTRDSVPRKATFTKYELFASYAPELRGRIRAFCDSVDLIEGRAADMVG